MGNQRVAASRAVDTFKEIARAIVRPTVVASQRDRISVIIWEKSQTREAITRLMFFYYALLS
jgi:hypothetical protein